VPARGRAGDAAYDLACVEPFTLAPGERALVGTGVAVAIPEGLCGLVLPRSGLAVKHGLSLVNAPGLIDPNYRGEIRVIVINHGDEVFEAAAGDRIAQLLITAFAAPELEVVGALPDSDRGVGGFGSSGR
jgi:dUTP pyrophosphatase